MFLMHSKTEKLPWGSGKANACGGSVRRDWVKAQSRSFQRSRKVLLRGREAPAFTHGEMSQYAYSQLYLF